jgi:hypothetical protein
MNNHERQPVIEVVVGDIAKFAADVIVNLAHESLAPGGGVSGALHRVAGPGLAAECAEIVENRGWLEAQAVTFRYRWPIRGLTNWRLRLELSRLCSLALELESLVSLSHLHLRMPWMELVQVYTRILQSRE